MREVQDLQVNVSINRTARQSSGAPWAHYSGSGILSRLRFREYGERPLKPAAGAKCTGHPWNLARPAPMLRQFRSPDSTDQPGPAGLATAVGRFITILDEPCNAGKLRVKAAFRVTCRARNDHRRNRESLAWGRASRYRGPASGVRNEECVRCTRVVSVLCSRPQRKHVQVSFDQAS